MTNALEARGVRYQYADGTVGLNGVDLSVPPGARYAILGPNGAGKSTLFLALAGLIAAEGEVYVFGERLTSRDGRQLRRRVGLVFQDADDMLFMPTLYDDVAFGPRNMGLTENEVGDRVAYALAATGLTGYGGRAPHRLSAGEKRRASIAAALALQPEILLLDEPTANLDGRGERELLEVARRFAGTVVVASHDLAFVGALCDAGAVMSAGKVVAEGRLKDILSDTPRLEELGLA